MTLNQHLAGVLLVVASALAFSVAGVLTKLISADTWTVVCWRGLLGGSLIVAYAFVTRRRRPASRTMRMNWQGWILAFVGAGSSFVFILAFKLTYVANVAVIYATAPFLAAILGWVLIGERVRWRTSGAALVSLVGVIIIVAGGLGLDRWAGDVAAMVMAAGNALYMVLIRLFDDTDAVFAGGISGLLLFGVAWFIADPTAVAGNDVLWLVSFGFAWAVALILWTEGTQLITAAESGLFGTAETPFAMFIAWMVLAELPPAQSLLGGLVVMAAVVAHGLADLRTADVPARSAAR